MLKIEIINKHIRLFF